MSRLDDFNLKPAFKVYRVGREELEKILSQMVENMTGVSVPFYINVHEDTDQDGQFFTECSVQFAGYETWADDEDHPQYLHDEHWDKLNALGLHPEEWFQNRDYLLQLLTGEDFSYMEADPTEDTIEIFVRQTHVSS